MPIQFRDGKFFFPLDPCPSCRDAANIHSNNKIKLLTITPGCPATSWTLKQIVLYKTELDTENLVEKEASPFTECEQPRHLFISPSFLNLLDGDRAVNIHYSTSHKDRPASGEENIIPLGGSSGNKCQELAGGDFNRRPTANKRMKAYSGSMLWIVDPPDHVGG